MMMSKTDEFLQLSRAEYFIAHSCGEVTDLDISLRLSQAASRLPWSYPATAVSARSVEPSASL